jgi:hypothetical protein
MPYLAGYAARLRINGAVFRFKRLRWRGRVDRLRTTNSEGVGGPVDSPGSHTLIFGNGMISLDVTDAGWDPLFNPFLAPRLVFPGTFLAIQVLPAGVGGTTLLIPSFGVVEGGQDIDIEGLSPFDFSGEGNGSWTYPFA